jgi:hypothetical protein
MILPHCLVILKYKNSQKSIPPGKIIKHSTIIPIIVYNVRSEDNITAIPAYLDITKCTVEFSDTELFKVTGYFDYVCLNWDGEKNMRVNMSRVDDMKFCMILLALT